MNHEGAIRIFYYLCLKLLLSRIIINLLLVADYGGLRIFALLITYNDNIKATMKKANVRRRKAKDEEKQVMSDVSYFSRLLYEDKTKEI